MSVDTRIALVTGGNRGIGRATAEALASDGTNIVLTYRSHEEEAEEVLRLLRGRGCRAEALRLDTSEASSFEQFTADLRGTLADGWGRASIDILVNNAGFTGAAVLGSTDEETLDQLYAVHFKGVYLLTQALVAPAADGLSPLLADGGRIVNVSSGLARFVTSPYAAYAAMKGAVEVLSRYWAQELGPRGISVNTVAPGPVATDFAGGYIRASETVQQELSARTALGRTALPKDIGAAVAALLSPGNAWMTGQRVELSGGFRL
ncbi:SDR family NAD(P)-dependent oxidoreductase [Nesterenkonia haasae]|uniref:SDR family NAD(P)-dependent oxidoreductase n=1 Tax=Nesterenkonia haasae TaxID=2587813 RepID=UPI002E2DB835|nr:SDR family oxidoreductase [Nesterenkonia haasae]